MPNGSQYGNLNYPSGYHHIGRFGASNSPLAQFLYPAAWRDVVYFFDDFIGGTNQEPAAADWNEGVLVAEGTNGTEFAPAGTQLTNGVCQGVTNNVAGDEQTLRTDLIWTGDQNCGMEIRFKVDNVTSLQHEIGFTDALSASTASAINDIDTPTITNGAADVALIGGDTGQTLSTLAFITDGSTTNMNTTKTNLGTRAITNATYITYRVQLTGVSSAVSASNAYVLQENKTILESAAHGNALASQIKGDVLLQWWLYFEPLTTAARTVDIDYLAIWQDRFTSF
jgi:hypothetical protein